MEKVCTKCRTPRPSGDFRKDRGKPDGLFSWCRSCCKKSDGAWYGRAGEAKKRRMRENYDPVANALKQQRRRPALQVYERTKRATDLQFKLTSNLRRRLHNALDRGWKSGSAVRDLGCTIPELKAWLEAKFYPHPETGEVMSWENWSPTGWHIDHKKPLASFDLTDREQLIQACHFTNLQPLWAEENLAKGAQVAA